MPLLLCAYHHFLPFSIFIHYKLIYSTSRMAKKRGKSKKISVRRRCLLVLRILYIVCGFRVIFPCFSPEFCLLSPVFSIFLPFFHFFHNFSILLSTFDLWNTPLRLERVNIFKYLEFGIFIWKTSQKSVDLLSVSDEAKHLGFLVVSHSFERIR